MMYVTDCMRPEECIRVSLRDLAQALREKSNEYVCLEIDERTTRDGEIHFVWIDYSVL